MSARLFIKQTPAPGDLIPLNAAQGHYLRDVLRLRPGAAFTAVLPDGTEADARLEGHGDSLGGRILALRAGRPRPPIRLILYAALTKRSPFEWMLEKTTEVGVAEILPVLAERCVVRPRPDRLPGQMERWRKIAEAAAAQSRSPFVPLVHLPLPFEAALVHWQAQGIPGIIFALPAERKPAALRTVLADMTSAPALGVFIGPEGDFSPREVAAAAAVGLRAASLGPRVLRAETAAAIAVALCLYDLSPP